MKNLLSSHISFDKLSPFILRIGLGFVFIYFGADVLLHTESWTGMVPQFLTNIAPANVFLKMHGIIELVGGILLVLGIYKRVVAGILSCVLFVTLFLISGSVLVRDIGLLCALLSLVIQKEN